MRLRPILFALVPVALTGLLVGCGKSPPPQESAPKVPATTVSSSGARPAEVGSPLFTPTAAPQYQTTISRNEPVVIANALAQFEERQVVPAEVDGSIDVIATPILPGEKVDPDQIVYYKRDVEKRRPLRRISESEEVKDGQILALLDDQQIDAKLKGAEKIKAAAEIALKAAGEGRVAAFKKLELTRKGDGIAVSQKEVLDDQLTYQRFVENEAQSLQTIARAEQDAAEATVILAKHQIKSRVNGIIRSIAKRPGEYVKAGEKIMEIEATDRVRIEGQLDVQYAPFIHRNMTVTVEPAVPSAPIAQHTGHRQPVTGIAVTSHADGPLVVSVGADGNALVWDPNLGKKANRPTVPTNLPHPVGVRSVAATPATSKATLVITGADDGKVRIWDVANRDRLQPTPKAEPEDAHTSAVHSIAISPDGRFFASAAGREVFIWDLAGAKKLYTLPAEHRDNVTAVSFTPQSTLVTTSKDGTVKVWSLGTEKAAVTRTFDHRVGAVEALGVSRDGARVLFDQDKGRIDLVDLVSGQTVGHLQNVSSAGSFSTLAVFGQQEVPFGAKEDALPPYGVLTVGGDGDLKGTVQYWHAPRTGGRGAEVGRLITPGRAPVTSAAFSPVRGEPFLVVGTSAGGVYLWKPPAEERRAHTGKIVNIDPTDNRYVTVRVEMSNKDAKLRDHSAVTIIVPTNP